MKRLLGLLLVLGMVGCGGGNEAPPAGDEALPATPNKPAQTVDASPASEAALPATPKNEPQAKVDEPPVQTVDASKIVERVDLIYEVNSETPFTGVVVAKHENGQKRLEATYKDGKPGGLSTSWHENGQKKAEGTFKNGKLEGLWTEWHKNGQKKAEGTFKDGKKVSETKWDEEGNVEE